MPIPLTLYEPVGRRVGGVAGAGIGGTAGGLLGALGSLLEPLDYPRQALWNIPRSAMRFFDQGDPRELAGLLPVLGGVAGGLVGGLPGAAIGAGLTQGLGKLTDEDTQSKRFEAPTGEDALRALGGDPNAEGGTIKSMLLQAVGDPLTYLGGASGARAGAKAGAGAGGATGADLVNKARWMGPQYSNEAGLRAMLEESLAKTISSPQHSPNNLISSSREDLLRSLLNSPQLGDISKEISPNMKFLGQGVETVAFADPANLSSGVTTIRSHVPWLQDSAVAKASPVSAASGLPAPRPVGEGVLPAIRQKTFPSEAGGYRVEHAPFSADVGEMSTRSAARAVENMYEELRDSLIKSGENPFDLHSQNIGWGPSESIVMRDPGASAPVSLGKGLPRPEPLPNQPNKLEEAILRLLGAPQAVRNELSATMPGPYLPPAWAAPEKKAMESDLLRRLQGMAPGNAVDDVRKQALAEALAKHSSRSGDYIDLGASSGSKDPGSLSSLPAVTDWKAASEVELGLGMPTNIGKTNSIDELVSRATAFNDLRDMLRAMDERGYVPTLRKGDDLQRQLGERLLDIGRKVFWIE